MGKVITIGEALIDFIPNEKGVALKEVTHFTKQPGGAPANVAACVAKLGGTSQFIGKLGEDAFGEFLIDTLKSFGVNTEGVIRTKEANTALAFVSLDKTGDRDFSFYRNPSADMLLDETEIDENHFKKEDILHFCSVDLIDAPVKKAHIKAIDIIKKKGGLVCFDPNVRLPLWPSEDACKQTIIDFIPYADILKISEEELEFITGIKDEDKAVESLFNSNEIKLILLTKGPKGVCAYFEDKKLVKEGFKVDVTDTTGAGDAFIGSFLYQVAEGLVNIEQLNEDMINEALTFSNGVGALTTTKKGAMEALPTISEVKDFINK